MHKTVPKPKSTEVEAALELMNRVMAMSLPKNIHNQTLDSRESEIYDAITGLWPNEESRVRDIAAIALRNAEKKALEFINQGVDPNQLMTLIGDRVGTTRMQTLFGAVGKELSGQYLWSRLDGTMFLDSFQRGIDQVNRAEVYRRFMVAVEDEARGKRKSVRDYLTEDLGADAEGIRFHKHGALKRTFMRARLFEDTGIRVDPQATIR